MPESNSPIFHYLSANHDDFYSASERKRQDEPMFSNLEQDGSTTWNVTRYEDAEYVMKNPLLFSNDSRRRNPLAAFIANLMSPEKYSQNTIVSRDPPDHTRLRRLIGKVFSPKTIEDLKPFTQKLANELIDGVIDHGQMDLVADYALPIPLILIANLLGIKTFDHQQFRRWGEIYVLPTSKEERIWEARKFKAFCSDLIAARKAHPGDDLISLLLQARDAGEKLSDQELYSMIFLLIFAGHATSVNLIASGALLLLQRPDDWSTLRTHPSMIPRAVEEMLRYETIAPSIDRIATQDTVLRGQHIKKGARVRIILSSANRDQGVFPHADQFDIERENNAHLAFGYGIHYCVGAPLARMEGQVALNTLMHRIPDLRLAVPPEALAWKPTSVVRALETLPVAWKT